MIAELLEQFERQMHTVGWASGRGAGAKERMAQAEARHTRDAILAEAAAANALITRAEKLIRDMMPGVRHIALPNYAELNDVTVALARWVLEHKP